MEGAPGGAPLRRTGCDGREIDPRCGDPRRFATSTPAAVGLAVATAVDPADADGLPSRIATADPARPSGPGGAGGVGPPLRPYPPPHGNRATRRGELPRVCGMSYDRVSR